jgi:CRISPR type III-A-associated protein Csm2
MPGEEIQSEDALLAAKALYALKKANVFRHDFLKADNRNVLQAAATVRLEFEDVSGFVNRDFPDKSRDINTREREDQLIGDIVDRIQRTERLSQTFASNADLVNFAEALGLVCANREASKQQMRTLLDALKEPRYKNDVRATVLLKPHLAYAAARGDALKPYADVMEECLDKFSHTEADKTDFEVLETFAQAVYAYYYGYAK